MTSTSCPLEHVSTVVNTVDNEVDVAYSEEGVGPLAPDELGGLVVIQITVDEHGVVGYKNVTTQFAEVSY